ncbi:MAG: hypothetical protein QM270_03010 [Bacillota bacterium]|nr:hypothetical protein [Bacillota bacterium]
MVPTPLISAQLAEIAVPSFFLPLLLVLTLLVGLAGLYFWTARRRRAAAITSRYRLIHGRIMELDGFSMTNAERIADILSDSGDRLLGESFAQMRDDGAVLMQGRWLPETSRYFLPAVVLEGADYRLLGNEAAQSVGIVGMLASLALTLYLALDPGAASVSVYWPLLLLPAVIGIAFALLLTSQATGSRREIEHHLGRLAEAVERRLPIYSERAGAVRLVDEFARYDRDMAAAVRRLQGSIDGLVHEDLARAVAASIERTMTEQIAPPLVEACDTLGRLADELTRRQEAGMQELADHFAARLGAALSEHLGPLFELIGSYADSIREARQQADLTAAAISGWLEQAEALSQATGERLQRLHEANEAWQSSAAAARDDWAAATAADLARWQERLEAISSHLSEQRAFLNEQLERLAGTSERLADLQAGNEAGLAANLAALSTSLGRFTAENNAVITSLGAANEEIGAMVETTRSEGTRMLSEYRRLSQDIGTSATGLERSATDLTANLARLNHELGQAVALFADRLQQGVNDTIREFDGGLAELSLRLAHTTAEVNETIDRMQRDLESRG